MAKRKQRSTPENNLNQAIYHIEKAIEQYGDLIDSEKLEEAIGLIEEALVEALEE